MKDDNTLDEYLAFNRLLSEGRFPLDNIAFLLFLDVVRWFDLDKTTNFMRYSEDVKLFWRTLFKRRFLRYMGGPKHKGQVISGETAPGAFKSETSQVNFIVPDRRTLTEEAKIVISDKPNILSLMIEQVAKSEQKTKQKTKSMGPTMIIKFFCHRRWSHRLISFCVFFYDSVYGQQERGTCFKQTHEQPQCI